MRVLLLIALLLWPTASLPNDRLVRLYAPDDLVETGLLNFILPRFTLKTQVRVELLPSSDGAHIVLGDDGRALFTGPSGVWRMSVPAEHPGAKRLADWLTSDVGSRTILGFAPDGDALFSSPPEEKAVVAEVKMDGDAIFGQQVAQSKCSRCHRVVKDGRMVGIGSTPSFFVLRTFPDWDVRFASFYVLKPHAAFTQITDVTDPFPVDRPSPIVPIELSLDEVEALLAYVSVIEAADLGAPLEHQ